MTIKNENGTPFTYTYDARDNRSTVTSTNPPKLK
ncbi:hypothetical protein KIK04_07660 [Paenibacillus sp. 481]|nr:hypothetical protein KIK04_07660 [Paenibacillus sp. 481]